MKFYARCLEVLNQNNGKKSKMKLQRTNKYAKVMALSLALAMMLGVSGCSKEESKTPTETGSSVETTEQGGSETESGEEEIDEFTLLADQLVIDGLTMTDDLTAKVEAEIQQQLDNINPGGTNYAPSDVYVAPDGSTWVSEEAYNNFIENGGTTNTTTEGYLAPDGNVWESEQAYLDYIAGQGESTTTIEGDFYTAPDGTIWSSQEEYEKYIASNNGQNEIPVENGTVVEDGEGYKAPDGTYWSSEQNYLDYISSLNNNNNSNSGSTDTGTSSEEIDYYKAPDGTIWDSEASYLDYIAGMDSTSASYEETGSGYEETVTYDNDYYFAPDGTVWESEEAYLAFIGSNSATYETGTGSTSSVEVIPESEYEEPTETYTEDMSSYYQDEEGNWWASYEDYLLYKQNEAELTR